MLDENTSISYTGILQNKGYIKGHWIWMTVERRIDRFSRGTKIWFLIDFPLFGPNVLNTVGAKNSLVRWRRGRGCLEKDSSFCKDLAGSLTLSYWPLPTVECSCVYSGILRYGYQIYPEAAFDNKINSAECVSPNSLLQWFRKNSSFRRICNSTKNLENTRADKKSSDRKSIALPAHRKFRVHGSRIWLSKHFLK